VAPAECAAFQDAWAKGDMAAFEALDKKLAPLHHALFVETSPAPVKYACSRLGFGTDEVRLPLVKASAEARRAVDEAMASVGILAPAAAGKIHARA
jgi:4-hydroxy-tetrahydrodipicolinate synthase